jgi:hypothetical protein
VTTLKGIEVLRRHGLFEILFRNAGVGLMFWEEERGEKKTGGPRPEFSLKPGEYDGGYARQKFYDACKVVYRYYPTLAQAVRAELRRVGVVKTTPARLRELKAWEVRSRGRPAAWPGRWWPRASRRRAARR